MLKIYKIKLKLTKKEIEELSNICNMEIIRMGKRSNTLKNLGINWMREGIWGKCQTYKNEWLQENYKSWKEFKALR